MRVCPFISLLDLGEQDESAMDPRAGLGRCLSVLDFSAAALGFWRLKSCDCFRLLVLFGFFLKSSALSHCKYQQSCSLYSKE